MNFIIHEAIYVFVASDFDSICRCFSNEICSSYYYHLTVVRFCTSFLFCGEDHGTCIRAMCIIYNKFKSNHLSFFLTNLVVIRFSGLVL